MPNYKASPEARLEDKLVSALLTTKARRDDVTKILIDLLASQIASYSPLDRTDVWIAAVDELDDMVELFSAAADSEYIMN